MYCSYLVLAVWYTCLWSMVIKERKRTLRSFRLLIDCLMLCLLRLRWCCIGQPMLIVENFNTDPGIIPCLAKGITAGRFVDLAVADSVRG